MSREVGYRYSLRIPPIRRFPYDANSRGGFFVVHTIS